MLPKRNWNRWNFWENFLYSLIKFHYWIIRYVISLFRSYFRKKIENLSNFQTKINKNTKLFPFQTSTSSLNENSKFERWFPKSSITIDYIDHFKVMIIIDKSFLFRVKRKLFEIFEDRKNFEIAQIDFSTSTKVDLQERFLCCPWTLRPVYFLGRCFLDFHRQSSESYSWSEALLWSIVEQRLHSSAAREPWRTMTFTFV